MNELEKNLCQYFSLSSSDSKTLADLFKTEQLLKGDYYLKKGRYCDKLSFIENGIFRIFAAHNDVEITQWIGTKGYFLTDLSGFVFRNLSRWNIQALTDSTIHTISYDRYSEIGKLIPKWNDYEKIFISKCFVMLENRIFSQISLSAEERYQLLFEQNRELFNQVPLQYLASMLGMTAETFSRIRRKLIS